MIVYILHIFNLGAFLCYQTLTLFQQIYDVEISSILYLLYMVEYMFYAQMFSFLCSPVDLFLVLFICDLVSCSRNHCQIQCCEVFVATLKKNYFIFTELLTMIHCIQYSNTKPLLLLLKVLSGAGDVAQ